MKLTHMPTWLTGLLLAGLSIIFILMPVHAFFSTWGGSTIGPLWLWKSWKELLLVVLALPVLVWLLTERDTLKQLAKKPLVIAMVAYLALSSILTAVYWGQNGADASLAGLAMNLRYLGIASLAYLLFLYGDISGVWLNRGKWLVVCAGVFVAVLGILQVLVVPSDALAQFGYDEDTTIAPAVLIDDNPGLLRAFATLRGPNDFGAFLVLPIVLVLAYFRRLPLWVSMTMLGFMGIALLLSSSRSAWLGMIVALAAYGLYAAGKKVSKISIVTICVLGVVSAASLFYATMSVPLLRQAIFHSSPGDSSLTEGSTDQHISATIGGVQRVIGEPLGCGLGCAGPASYYGNDARISENYFVQIAEETGVIGLIFFLTIVGLVLFQLHTATNQRTLSRALVAAGLGYVVIGQLLHVWSDDPLSITWWMLVGAMIGYNESTTWKKSKNSLRSKT